MPRTKAEKIEDIALYGSKWVLTVNTNQPIEYGNLDFFTSIVQNLVLSRNIYNFFEYKRTVESPWIRDPPVKELLSASDDLKMLSSIETKGIFGKVHANITISLIHFNYFRIDGQKLAAWFTMKAKGRFTIKGQQLHIKPRPLYPTDQKYNIKEYGVRNQFPIYSTFYDSNGKLKVFSQIVDIDPLPDIRTKLGLESDDEE